jgi:hypothetical protein
LFAKRKIAVPNGIAYPLGCEFSKGIFWNKLLGTATSAKWNVTYRPWHTTLAPILTSFSCSIVND